MESELSATAIAIRAIKDDAVAIAMKKLSNAIRDMSPTPISPIAVVGLIESKNWLRDV